MNPHPDLPNLSPQNHRETSPRRYSYNCVAWAAGDDEHWWTPGGEPGDYWPVACARNDFGYQALTEAFRSLGYEECDSGDGLEPGYQKIALYGSGVFLFTHAARQLPSGKWTSKLGGNVDIEHDTPDVLAGGVYGEVFAIMRRPVAAQRTA